MTPSTVSCCRDATGGRVLAVRHIKQGEAVATGLAGAEKDSKIATIPAMAMAIPLPRTALSPTARSRR